MNELMDKSKKSHEVKSAVKCRKGGFSSVRSLWKKEVITDLRIIKSNFKYRSSYWSGAVLGKAHVSYSFFYSTVLSLLKLQN